MPSAENGLATASRWTWLRSQGLGVICGFATVLLLAVGSVVIAFTRDGASKKIALDDIRIFFDEPDWTHAWFYLLLPVLCVYGLNTLLATWHSVITKWRAGVRKAHSYAASVIHISFLIALLAHLVGGLYSFEHGMVRVGPDWGPLGDGRSARVVALDVDTHPDGKTKQVHASLEVRDEGGDATRALVEYNAPLTSRGGRDLFLLTRMQQIPVGFQLLSPLGPCQLRDSKACRVGDAEVRLLGMVPAGQMGPSALARVRVQQASGTSDQWLLPGRPLTLEGGHSILLGEIESSGMLLLRRRHAAGNPLALLSAIVLLIGVAMMYRRLARPSAWRPASHPDEFL